MNEQDFYPESSRSLDSLRQMRLLALLRDMIEAEGKVQTAAALGVNYRTLVRHEETGRLTDRMADALERQGPGRCGTWNGGWCGWKREGASPRRPLRPEQRLSRRSEGTFAQGRIPRW